MSSRRPREAVLSPAARLDFEDIVLHGIAVWGEERAERYGEALLDALQRIGRYPNLGRDAVEIGQGLRRLVVREHVVLYRVTDEAVLVVRLLHRRQDAAQALGS